jgi:AcrR family transcriptional regulator
MIIPFMFSTTPQALAPGLRAQKREELIQRVQRAALELFAERGYHGTSIPMILEAAEVSASSLYRLFPSKEALVNAVFLEAKTRLGDALGEVEDEPRADRDAYVTAHARFVRIWDRLARFAAEAPVTFRFLELQDHTPYLDGPSRTKELSVLAPLALTCMDLQRRGVLRAETGVDVMLATIWGALVGLVKAERLGYLTLDDDALAEAREALWRGFATEGGARAPAAPRSTDVENEAHTTSRSRGSAPRSARRTKR